MENIFLEILNMSITASWLTLAVIVLRCILKKAPKSLRVILWAMVGIRLVCPFSFESVLSLLPSKETVSEDILYAQNPTIESGVPVINNAVNNFLGSNFSAEPTNSVNPLQVMTYVSSYIWVIGIAVMLCYTIFSFLRIKKKVAEALLLNENIFICDRIDTPFILGIFRPCIYLPSSMNDEDRELVIAHEKAHISRRDHLWKPLGFLLLTVYWFNPVMWIAYILLCKDIELACDEKVIKKEDIGIKKAYSNALINCSAERKLISACPLAFGETGVKGRIKSVLSYKKPAFWVILVAVIAVVVTGVCFLTDPNISTDDELSAFIDTQITEYYQSDNITLDYSAIDWKVLGKTNKGNETTVYMWVMYQEYIYEDEIKESYGAHILTAISAEKIDGKYVLTEYWEPEDGSMYTDSIRKKVPLTLWSKAMNSQRYVEEQKNACYALAEEHFSVVTKNFLIIKEDYYVKSDEGNVKTNNGTYELHNQHLTANRYVPTIINEYNPYEFSIIIEQIKLTYAVIAFTNPLLLDGKSVDRIELYYDESIELFTPTDETYIKYTLYTAEGISPDTVREQEMNKQGIGEKTYFNNLTDLLNYYITENVGSSIRLLNFCCPKYVVLAEKTTDEETTAYLRVLYEEYDEETQKKVWGVNTSLAITYKKTSSGYELVEFWAPRDENRYEESIKEKFPEDVWEEAIDLNIYSNYLNAVCQNEVGLHFGTITFPPETLYITEITNSLDENTENIIGIDIFSNICSYDAFENFCSLAFAVLDKETAGDKTTYYLRVKYSEYNVTTAEVVWGSNSLCAVTLQGNELVEFWKPQYGNMYITSVKEKIPESLWEEIFNLDTYNEQLNDACEKEFEQRFDSLVEGETTILPTSEITPGKCLMIKAETYPLLNHEDPISTTDIVSLEPCDYMSLGPVEDGKGFYIFKVTDTYVDLAFLSPLYIDGKFVKDYKLYYGETLEFFSKADTTTAPLTKYTFSVVSTTEDDESGTIAFVEE